MIFIQRLLTTTLIVGLIAWTVPVLADSEAENYFMRGQIYAGQKAYDKAIAEYTRAIAADSKYEKAYVGLGLIYGMRKQYDRAISQFEKALKINSKASLAYKGLGLVYKDKGNKKAAVEAFESYLRYAPQAKDRKEVEGVLTTLRKELGQSEPKPSPVATTASPQPLASPETKSPPPDKKPEKTEPTAPSKSSH